MPADCKPKTFPLKTLFVTCATTILMQSCAQVPTKELKPIKIDGSSTVFPITEAILKDYNADPKHSKIEIKSEISGTRGGFRKFCAGKTDINGASRPILAEEMTECNKNEVRYIELPIAFDALTVVVNPKNTWTTSLTTQELKTMWEPSAQGKVKNWKQINPAFPNNPLTLYGPGKDSGTFDYFTEAIMGTADASRTDYVYSEDDEVIVNGVKQDPNALGYFGYAIYDRHKDHLKAVAIDSGKGPIIPSRETVESAQYQPLARPLFIYINAKAAQENPALEEFVEYYLAQAPTIVPQVGYIPLPDEGYYLAKIHFQRFKIGTVFGGKAEFNLTIGELLRKQAQIDVTQK